MVLEVNSAPDFTRDYSLGVDVFERVAAELAAALETDGSVAVGAA